MSNGIQALAANRMRELLAKFAGTPVKGVLAGTVITGVLQSSTAMTVMVVGLVNAGVVALRPAISVIMGANIGTTLGNGLIALPLGPSACCSRACRRWSTCSRRMSGSGTSRSPAWGSA